MTTNINLTLSKTPLDNTSYGYQEPISDDQVEAMTLQDITDSKKAKSRTSGPSRRGRRASRIPDQSRGGHGAFNRVGNSTYNDDDYEDYDFGELDD